MNPEEIAAAAATAKAIADADAAKAASDAAKVAADAEAAALVAGKKQPTDEEARLLKDVMSKKAKLDASEVARIAAEDKLKAFDGIDPVAYKKLKDEALAREQDELVKRGEFDKIKAQMNEQTATQIAEKDAVIAGKDGTIGDLAKQIADLTVGNAFTTSKFISEDLALTVNKARVIYGSHFEFKDGKIVGYDLPLGSKDRAPFVDAKGSVLSFEDALKKIVDADPDKESLLKSKIVTGAGSGTMKIAPGKTKESQSETTGIDKITAALNAKK